MLPQEPQLPADGAARTFAPSLSTADHCILWLLAVYGAVVLLALAAVPLRFLPAEDAVILFDYSRNLAQHGVITFAAGSAPVEGATDFGWMLLSAGAMRCGIAPFWFCAVANVVSLVLLGCVLLRTARLHATVFRIAAIAGAAGLFRQIFAAASGFSVLPDALLLCSTALLALRQQALLAALTAFLFCLFRPDGIVFAVPLLACVLLRSSRRRHDAVSIAAAFVLPGVAYFLWRWHYFHQFLPLPFMVKADFHRDFGFLILGSVRASLVPLLVTALVLLPVIRLRRRVGLLFMTAMIAIPTLFFWMMRLDQNVGARFFYYLPASSAFLIAMSWPQLKPRVVLRTAFLVFLVLLAAPLYREWLTFRSMQFGQVKQIAEELHGLPVHGTLLVSEAGILPYYSHWPSVDPWGLNTPEFAHRFFQPSDVAGTHPDLIVIHPDMPESCLPDPAWQEGYRDRSWPHMTRNIVLGAAQGHYDLWLLSYGSEFYRQRKHWAYGQGDRECWFVDRASPLRGAIRAILRANHGIGPPQSLHLEEMHRDVAATR